MAIINSGSTTAQIRSYLNSGTTIDTNVLIDMLNSALPEDQKITANSTAIGGIYKTFGTYDTVNSKVEVVTTGIWSGDSGSLTTFYTSSTQAASTSGQYYYNVYNTNTSAAEIQFAVAYGHKNGSGSVSLDIDDNALLATKATYAQYRSILLDSTSSFSFNNGSGTYVDADDVYIINLSRNRYRERMDAGNWSLTLSGSNGKFTLIDNSGKKFGDSYGLSGTVFDVVSGSLNLGTQSDVTINTATASNGLGFGRFYSDKGIIVLNPKAIGQMVGNVPDSASIAKNLSGSLATTYNTYNHVLLVNSIAKGGSFEARRTENISTQHFFVRATNREFNYSNNPTYVTSTGYFSEPTFEKDPKTYITTVGLYNGSNELIAVAKTSQPIMKSFDQEILLKIKLSF